MQSTDPYCKSNCRRSKSPRRRQPCEDKCGDCFVAVGPSTTALFQGNQDVYIRPASQTLDKLHTAGSCLSLVLDSVNAVEGVRVESDGLYNVSVSAFLESFASDDVTDRSGIVGFQDVRVFIDDAKFTFPVSANGQSMQVSAPLFGQDALQNPSLAYSANIYLERKQQLNFGFLYTSAQDDNYYRLTLQWSVVKVGKESCAHLYRVYSGRVVTQP